MTKPGNDERLRTALTEALEWLDEYVDLLGHRHHAPLKEKRKAWEAALAATEETPLAGALRDLASRIDDYISTTEDEEPERVSSIARAIEQWAARREPGPRWTPSGLAKRFHQLYEYLAPKFGYETRKESSVQWEQVPGQNRNLMTAVCEHILKELEVEAAGPGDRAMGGAREVVHHIWCKSLLKMDLPCNCGIENVARAKNWLLSQGKGHSEEELDGLTVSGAQIIHFLAGYEAFLRAAAIERSQTQGAPKCTT